MNNDIYEENWAVFPTEIDERIGLIMVDIGLAQIAPVESKPFLITLTTFINEPDENGFPTESETETLNSLEDKITALFVSKFDAIYAGRIKSGGAIQCYYYAAHLNEIENVVSEIERQNPTYRFAYDTYEEKDWEAYFNVLYPTPVEMQVIQNSSVIQNLQKHGDKLEMERAVDHWIYFKSEADRENFLEAIKNDGFEIVQKDKNDSEDFPFSLQISRSDKVDHQSANEYIIYLWQKAQEFDGNYDGWETFIVRD